MTVEHRTGRRRDNRGRIITLLAVTGVGIPALAAGVFGMPAMQALLIGAVCVAVAAPLGRPLEAPDLTFPDAPKPQSNRGIRRDAFQLSWSVASSNDRVGTRLIIRIQRIARRRLAARGLELFDPGQRDQIVGQIGERAYQSLVTLPSQEVSRRDFRDTLAAVENLDPAAGSPLADDQLGKDQ